MKEGTANYPDDVPCSTVVLSSASSDESSIYWEGNAIVSIPTRASNIVWHVNYADDWILFIMIARMEWEAEASGACMPNLKSTPISYSYHVMYAIPRSGVFRNAAFFPPYSSEFSTTHAAGKFGGYLDWQKDLRLQPELEEVYLPPIALHGPLFSCHCHCGRHPTSNSIISTCYSAILSK